MGILMKLIMKFKNFKFHILSIIEFNYRHTSISMVVWLSSFVFSLIFILFKAWLFLLISFFVSSVSIFLILQRCENILNLRIADSKSEMIWDVSVNGIKVGFIPDWAYAHILKRALFDPMTWFFELYNLLSYFKNVLIEIFLGVPALAFWVILTILILYPDHLVKIKKLDIHMVSESFNHVTIRLLVVYILISFVVRVAFLILSKSKYGFFEYLDLNVNSRVRGFVKFAGDGNVAVYSVQNGKYISASKYRVFDGFKP
jgi:hypothetical protein